VCFVLFFVCLYICVLECLLQNNNHWHEVEHKNNTNCWSAFEPGASGLPYYCTSICVRSWGNWRASSVDLKKIMTEAWSLQDTAGRCRRVSMCGCHKPVHYEGIHMFVVNYYIYAMPHSYVWLMHVCGCHKPVHYEAESLRERHHISHLMHPQIS